MNKLLLGESTKYKSNYDKSFLYKIPRLFKRQEIGIINEPPFYGFDIWNAYEVSWLNQKGKPLVRIAEFIYTSSSLNIIESKSFKLYLNSFNNTKFDSESDVIKIMQQDLSECVGSLVNVNFSKVDINSRRFYIPEGVMLDDLDIDVESELKPHYSLIQIESDQLVNEVLFSNLMKSNCLVTNQPDWAMVEISYIGKKINRNSLLKYIISFRNHNEFHEQCVERMFIDIKRAIQPEELKVYARYTRRGGLDINPVRSTNENLTFYNFSDVRQ